jgi:anti-sigma regulatory factor (Ser/Thr protein kinase)
MQSKHLHYYQIFAWLSVFTVVISTIHLSRGVAEHELYFAVTLIGSTALYSYLIRYLFVRYVSDQHIFLQIIYLLIQSALGATIGALMLIACVLAFSFFGVIPAIPSDSIGFAVRSIFWLNWMNMFGALIFWSIAYLLLIKMRQLYTTKEALASSRLEALSQQLNPHFLFNTLNNIRASILEEPQKARDALAQLADMLRYTLEEHKSGKIALHKELAIVEEFIALCKIQFENRLSFQADIQNGAHDALIPRMLLQLCVENAIKHGISNLNEGGLVSLQVSIKEQNAGQKSLNILITNPVSRSETKTNNYQNRDYLNAGLGLKNIKQRLALLYSHQRSINASLAFSVEKNIAKVQIIIPLEYEQEPDMTKDLSRRGGQ